MLYRTKILLVKYIGEDTYSPCSGWLSSEHFPHAAQQHPEWSSHSTSKSHPPTPCPSCAWQDAEKDSKEISRIENQQTHIT